MIYFYFGMCVSHSVVSYLAGRATDMAVWVAASIVIAAIHSERRKK